MKKALVISILIAGCVGPMGPDGKSGSEGATGPEGPQGSAAPVQTIVASGQGRNWADGTIARSCYAYRYPSSPLYQYAGMVGDGVYTIDPDGPGGNPELDVYCDMTTDDGGWTLAVGIGADEKHLDIAAVTPENMVSATGKGKLADATINNLKSGISPAYRLQCQNITDTVTGYWPASCEFAATADASGPCAAQTYVWPVTEYGTTRFVETGAKTLADGSSGTTDRLIYGTPGRSACDTSSGWAQSVSGALWVR